MRLYDLVRQRLGLSPMDALRWIYGPEDLPASRLQNFMAARRESLRRMSKSFFDVTCSTRNAIHSLRAYEAEMRRVADVIKTATETA